MPGKVYGQVKFVLLTGNADFIYEDSFPTLGKMFCLSIYLVPISLKFVVELGVDVDCARLLCSLNISRRKFTWS